MRAGFEHYRAFPQTRGHFQNQNYSKTKLAMPVLALGGGYIPTFGGNITTIIYGMKILAQNVTGITVSNSVHYIPEEQPQFVINQLFKFFSVVIILNL